MKKNETVVLFRFYSRLCSLWPLGKNAKSKRARGNKEEEEENTHADSQQRNTPCIVQLPHTATDADGRPDECVWSQSYHSGPPTESSRPIERFA